MNELDRFLQQHPDVEMFEVFMPDLNGRLRGKWIPRDNIQKVFTGSLKMPLSTQALDAWGNDLKDWVMENGDADGICTGEPRTLSIAPWLGRPTGQLLLSMNQVNGAASPLDCRALVEALSHRLKTHGFTPVMACEMEFHLLSGVDHRGRPVHTQVTAEQDVCAGGDTYGIVSMQHNQALMHDIRDTALAQKLPVDTLIKESAPSQYEINLYHEADALLSADQSLLLRRVIQGVALQHRQRATFMAKPFADSAGSGMHVHCSLLDGDGNNVFNSGDASGTPLLRQAIAGALAGMADCMLLLAPHANSYRRFSADAHAPLSANWGYENRTVAIRIPADKPVATRLEYRVAGADANPYLIYAAVLAGILHGIENTPDCPTATEGNAYQQDHETLPNTWQTALEKFSNSGFVTRYFGAEFQRVFGMIKQQEQNRFALEISPFEYATYL